MIRVRLTRKLALVLNGVDVSDCEVGDVLALPEDDARMLIAERWAAPLSEPAFPHWVVRPQVRKLADGEN